MPDPTILDDASFEADLSQRLHGRALPASIPGLERTSARRGRQIRRRRRLAGAALATAVIVGAAVGGAQGPALFGARVTPVAPAAPPTVAGGQLARPDALPLGAAPRVDYVADSVWHRADGTTVPLRQADRGDGAVSWVHSGDHLFVGRTSDYAIDGGPYRSVPGQDDLNTVAGAPGPDGSVLVENKVLSVYGRDGQWRNEDAYGSYAGKFTTPHPARTTVWAVDERDPDTGPVVVRRSSLAADATTTTIGDWQHITTSDPRSDQVVLRDGTALGDPLACNVIVDGTTGRERWKSCSWTFLRLSSDGRYVLARGDGGLAVLDIAEQTVVYALGSNEDLDDTTSRFADDDTLTVVVRNPADGSEGIVSCDLAGTCSRSTPWTKDFHYVLVTGDR